MGRLSRLKDFQEKQKKLSRFQALKSIFTSFAMTVTVVVIAAVVVPKSPSGSIDSVEAFTDVITYTVNVVDEDNAIIPDTLCLRLENQLEVYDRDIGLGMNSGIFENLNPKTEYTLKILANKGYGQEVLDRITLTTAERTGGAITGFLLLSEEDAWSLDYNIDYFISDPFDEYQAVNLRYATKYPSQEEYQFYTTVGLDEDLTQTLIQSIYNENQEINIILEATTQDDQIVILDNLTFHTPFRIYASMGIEQVTNQSVSVYVWPEPVSGLSIEYELVLSRLGYIIDSYIVPPIVFDQQTPQQFDSSEITFTDLAPEKEYHVELIARYSDPYTLANVEKVLASEDFVTTPDFNYTIDVTDHDDHYLVTVTVDPEDAIYDFAYYNTYVYVNDFYQFFAYQSFVFENIDGQLVATFIIYKPDNPEYRIIIAIGDSEYYINFFILERIETTQEG